MKIEYVTHASLLLRSGGLSLLTDPFFQFDPWDAGTLFHFPPRELDLSALGRLDYVYSSHIHPDHSHPGTLRRLLAQIGTVLLPAEHPALVERYRALGFDNLVLLPNGETVKLRDGLEVTSFWDGRVDTVLVVRMGDTVVLHENDCWLRLETVQRIAERFSIDYAFMLYTATQDLFPLLLSRPEEELVRLAREREERSFAYQLGCIDLLKPKVVVPYSMTMTYFQPDQLRLNGYGRMLPSTFRQRLAAERPGLRCEVMQPGDVIDAVSGAIARERPENLWGDDLDAYLHNVEVHARTHRARAPVFDPGEVVECVAPLKQWLRERLASPAPWPAQVQGKVLALHVVGRSSSATYLVDLGPRRLMDAGPGWRQWLPAAKRPVLEISLPASTLRYFLDKVYDPFSLLFTYRVTFQTDASLCLAPREEVNLSIDTMMALFAPDASEDVGAV
ncbi:MBL fold metallo-hydrolase [Myxococcaceae bacterium GXIMD 01537]